MDTKAQLTDINAVRCFMTAGNATFTIVSRKTGKSFTYSLVTPQGRTGFWFTRVLTGPDNTSDYTWAGSTFTVVGGYDLRYRHSDKSSLSQDAPSVRAYEYLLRTLNHFNATQLPENLEFWTSGHCGVCGRTLTNRESIERGIGPKCARSVGAL